MGHLPSLASRGLAAPDADRVRKALAASLSENTRRAYLGHWRAFEAWCQAKGYQAAPATPEAGAAHRAAGLGDPTAEELVKRALAGLVREAAAPQRQALALDLAALAAIRATACSPPHGPPVRAQGIRAIRPHSRPRRHRAVLDSLLRGGAALGGRCSQVGRRRGGGGRLRPARRPPEQDRSGGGGQCALPAPGRHAVPRGGPPRRHAAGGSRVRALGPAGRAARRGRDAPPGWGRGFPGIPGAWAWPPSSVAPVPPRTRSPRRAGGSRPAW